MVNTAPLEVSLRVWFNEEMKESNYMIPSELGFIAAAIAAMVASMAIARERELGTLEQLMVTPLRTLELVIGKSVVAISLGYAEFLLMLGLVVWGFHVPLRGSLPLLMVIAFFYMLVELGWGLMISAVARTQMQALLIAFAVVMVMVIFCGYAFPVETLAGDLSRHLAQGSRTTSLLARTAGHCRARRRDLYGNRAADATQTPGIEWMRAHADRLEKRQAWWTERTTWPLRSWN
jgi:ABC-type multidrug transport system permease subunit